MNDEQVQCLMAAILKAGDAAKCESAGNDWYAKDAVTLFRAVQAEARKTPTSAEFPPAPGVKEWPYEPGNAS